MSTQTDNTQNATKTLESQPASNRAAISTPHEISAETLDGIVSEIAANKAANGYSVVKGNGCFSSACQKVKSLLSIGQKDRLPESVASAIKAAVDRLVTKQLRLINESNFASSKSDVVLRNGVSVNKRQLIGYDAMSDKERIFFSNIKINDLKLKRGKAELAYDDAAIERLDNQIAKWSVNKLMAEQGLKLQAEASSEAKK